MNRYIVVIPNYKYELNQMEQISFNQAIKIFGEKQIKLIEPERLINFSFNTCINNISFHDKYFDSVDAYNHLMLSSDFYKQFSDYEYILIYQLDAFVFDNRLDYFCNMGYDYIGAPWLMGFPYYRDKSHKVWRVGNGGLSLRRVDACIKALEDNSDLLDKYINNEDLFFSMCEGDNFKCAPVGVALDFSMERQVRTCFEMNNHRLPFGCHAWEKYDYEFWKPYIESLGYNLPHIDSVNGSADKELFHLYSKQKAISDFFDKVIETDMIKDKVKNLVKDKEIWLFGAGFYGSGIFNWFESLDVNLQGYIDNQKKLQELGYQGKQVISIAEYIVNHKGNMILVTALSSEYEIANQLEEEGLICGEDYILLSKFVEIIGE